MNYFTKEEADKCLSELIKYIGLVMKHGPEEGALSKVIDIQIQPTHHEITNYGVLEFGFIVIVLFEKHSGLVPALFCEFNGLTPIYATHKALNTGEKNQLVTRKNIQGEWIYKNGADSLSVIINESNVIIKGNLNGIEENTNFSSNGHWMDYYIFMFMDDPYYFISFANKKEMGFAKLKNPRVFDANLKWQLKLVRV